MMLLTDLYAYYVKTNKLDKDFYLSSDQCVDVEFIKNAIHLQFNDLNDRKIFWQKIVCNCYEDLTYFPNEVVEFLISNNIELGTLSHLSLSNFHLEKIYECNNDYIEALITILKRFMYNSFKPICLINFIKKYDSKYLCLYALYLSIVSFANDDTIKKVKRLCAFASEHFSNDDKFMKRFKKYYVYYLNEEVATLSKKEIAFLDTFTTPSNSAKSLRLKKKYIEKETRKIYEFALTT